MISNCGEVEKLQPGDSSRSNFFISVVQIMACVRSLTRPIFKGRDLGSEDEAFLAKSEAYFLGYGIHGDGE